MTPKSLADSIGFKLAPRSEMLGLCGTLLNICLVPRKRRLVLSGFMSKWFSQHHWATLRRSCSSFSTAPSSSIRGKDQNNFELSMYDSRLLELGVSRVDHSDKCKTEVVTKSVLDGHHG